MTVKSEKDLKALREGGKRLAFVLSEVVKLVKPGASARELDILAERLIKEGGDTPSFLNYTPDGAERPYPATLCVSINEEVVHGIPNEDDKFLKEGDIVGLDIGLWHDGICVDMAVTVPVGEVSQLAKKLIDTTRESLKVGIKECTIGKNINDIGCAIEKFVKSLKPSGFGIVEELGGHGVGKKVHEKPYIPNFCLGGESPKITEGMVLALEPMLNEGTKEVVLDNDGYTFKTADNKLSAHFEHTVLVTKKGPEIITVL